MMRVKINNFNFKNEVRTFLDIYILFSTDTELIAISENLNSLQQLSIMGTRNVTPGKFSLSYNGDLNTGLARFFNRRCLV